MKSVIMTGDEAIARGAWEAGCSIAAAYPGTPSTEILENIGEHYKDDIYSQWACNEKVALEIAVGGAIGGARSLAAMKHVGLNVAADPFFTAAYTGVKGGLVVVTADDPGCHSSQNEQDNRHYAAAAKAVLLEPSDSQECKDFTKLAFEISEQFDAVVLLRVTTRVCHSKSLVTLDERNGYQIPPYQKNGQKYIMLPVNARVRHVVREDSLIELEKYSNQTPLNRIEWGDKSVGVITSGISYQHSREVFSGGASYLKLGFTNPMPKDIIRQFASGVDKLYIVEEGDPFIENTVRALGFDCIGKSAIPLCGELDAGIIQSAFFGQRRQPGYQAELEVPPRSPVMCAGCPHRGFFQSLKKHAKKLVRIGDIGCYTLGASPPMNGFDVTICMGSGFSSTIGMSRALEQQGDDRKVLGMMGDSTFFHSGITGLIDIVHSNANVCACILDNSITAMTGHQQNPGTPVDLRGYQVPPVSIEKMVLATGIPEERLRIVDPVDQAAMDEAVSAALDVKGPFVIITRRPCALLKDFIKANAGNKCEISAEKCTGCKACMQMACPAMAFSDGKAAIYDPDSCTGCGLCRQLCKFGAISRTGGNA